MSDPEFENIGWPDDILIEECSELIKALCKAKRFGLFNPNTKTGKTNFDLIKEEIKDVEKAIDRYLLRNNTKR